ncbi:Xaa-Pro peptidase family protein [Phyllobacterium sp. SB3]|uniref:M24 family metallopeptidase n=1 Tax=Phyllobacterium sp. SB3 TaxID=3156073 RepID=UPI0032AED4EE
MNIEPIHHAPPPEEITARIGRLQVLMEERKLDYYVSFSTDNIYYLTNFANYVHERPFVLVIPVRGTPHFVVPRLEIPHVLARAIGKLHLVEYLEFPARDGENWFDRLGDILRDAKQVGVESICPLQIYEAITAQCVRTDLIDDLRMIKSPYEMGRMVHAAQIATDAMADLLANARPGRTLQEVSAAGSRFMFERLRTDSPSLNILATKILSVFQPRSVAHDPHNFTDLDMVMEAGGPHVSVLNAVMNGYGTEIERTFFLGHVPEEAKRPYEVMMEARRLTFELTRPGTPMSEVDKKVAEVIVTAGYENGLLTRTGHGMGVTAHEGPFLAEGDRRILQPGMSFTIEPGIFLPGIGGFRHSDTILLTEKGNISLTYAPDSLEDMTLDI